MSWESETVRYRKCPRGHLVAASAETCPECERSDARPAEVPAPQATDVHAEKPEPEDVARPLAPPPSTTRTGVLTFLGVLAMVVGFLMAVNYMFMFDTSVRSGEGLFDTSRTHNIGLISDRANGVLFGVGLWILGGLLLIADRLPPRS